MLTVCVASKNPVKIAATSAAFSKVFQGAGSTKAFEFIGVNVESGVANQPVSRQETLTGATNRAHNAKLLKPDANFWVGIESGIEDIESTDKSLVPSMWTFAYVVVIADQSIDGQKRELFGTGSSGEFILPEKVAALIRSGMELGTADDIVFNRENSKQENGAVGILTNNILTRQNFYEPAVILALIPVMNPNLY